MQALPESPAPRHSYHHGKILFMLIISFYVKFCSYCDMQQLYRSHTALRRRSRKPQAILGLLQKLWMLPCWLSRLTARLLVFRKANKRVKSSFQGNLYLHSAGYSELLNSRPTTCLRGIQWNSGLSLLVQFTVCYDRHSWGMAEMGVSILKGLL